MHLNRTPRGWFQRGALAVTTLVVTSMLIVASISVDPRVAESQDTIEDARREQQRLQQQAVDAATEIDLLRTTDRELVAAVELVGRDIVALDAELQAARNRQATAERRRADAEGEREELVDEITELRRNAREQAIEAYLTQGSAPTIGSVTISSDLNRGLSAVVLIDAAQDDVFDVVDRIRFVEDSVAAAEADALTAKREATAIGTQVDAQLVTLTERQEAYQELEDEVNARILELEAEAEQWREASDDLGDFIRAEQGRMEAEQLAAEQAEIARLEAERIAAEQAEAELIEAARIEAERIELEQLALERLLAEQLAAAQLEAELAQAEEAGADAPTPTPLTVTATPQPTPTLVPTPESDTTPTPDPTPTLQATTTPTPEPTSTAAPTPSATPAASPTATTAPSATAAPATTTTPAATAPATTPEPTPTLAPSTPTPAATPTVATTPLPTPTLPPTTPTALPAPTTAPTPAPAPPPAVVTSSSGMVWPVTGALVSNFGNRVHPIFGTVRMHNGLDLDGNMGDPIVAARSGTVLSAGWQSGYGNTIVLDHGDNLSTVYAHQTSFNVAAGDAVQTGDLIGFIGSTGNSTGPHLHFEVRVSGSARDPLGYLPAR